MRFSSTSCPKKPLLPVLTFPTFHIPPASYLAYSAGVSHVFTNYSISSRSGRFAAMLDSFSSLPKPFPNFESKMALAWSKYTCYSPRLLPPCCPPSIPPPPHTHTQTPSSFPSQRKCHRTILYPVKEGCNFSI